MAKIIGNTTATTSPQSDYNQTDSTKADYIKNKPVLGTLASKSTVEKSDVASDIQASLNKADTAIQSLEGLATEDYVDNSIGALGGLAGKSTVEKSDLSTDVQESLNKADSALQSFTETDPTVPAWAKADAKPTYTASEVGAVPTSRTVNGKALSANITLSASDVGALPSSTDIPDSLSDLASDTTHRTVTDIEKSAWNAKSDFSGSYNDLTDKPSTFPPSAHTHEYIPTSQKGVANGVADLDANGKVPSSQLPSYVDDVIEGTYVSSTSFNNTSGTAVTGETGKIYVDTTTNKTYRWSGSAYAEISASLALGTTSSTAYRGDYGDTAYKHSQKTSGNPHGVTKSDVGLGSVVNTGDSDTPVSGGTTKFTTGGAYTELAKKVDKVSGKGLSTNDYTTDEKNKLAGIASGANAYTHPSSHPASMITGLATVATSGSYNDLSNKPTIPAVVTVDSELSSTSTNPVQNKVINSALDGKAAASDLTSHTSNTTSHITSTERTNWNAAKTHADTAHAPSNAEKNQNAFSNITVDSTTIAADSTTDTLTLVGSNVTITPDATNDKVTIGITKANVTSALGYTPPTTDTTYSAATQSASGLMSADDKKKLDGIAANANNYSLPAAGSSLGGVKTGGDVAISSGVITVNDDSHNHVISNVDGLQDALNGKAPTSHASSSTTYGISSTSNYGHAMASSTTPKANGTAAVGSETAKFARGDHVHPLQTTVSGNAGTATKLETARSIALGTGATGTATNFDGSSNITIPVTSVKESYLEWGGKDISGGFTPLDAALIEELSANRLAGLSSSRVTFERSSDGGSTWTTYTGNADLITTSGSASNANTTSSQSIYNWHRITINIADAIYCVLKKIAIYLSTNGATGCKCKIEWGDYSSSTVWTTAKIVDISGWPSWNIINVSRAIGNPTYDKTKYVRLTFSQTGVDLNYSSQLLVYKIRFYSDNCWSAPNNFAETGHVYSYDASLNATFPASVNATSLKENGTALSSKYAAKSHNQASNTINAMTGYSKPSSTSAISPSDTLNSAIGKLEKALDGVETLLASI